MTKNINIDVAEFEDKYGDMFREVTKEFSEKGGTLLIVGMLDDKGYQTATGDNVSMAKLFRRLDPNLRDIIEDALEKSKVSDELFQAFKKFMDEVGAKND